MPAALSRRATLRSISYGEIIAPVHTEIQIDHAAYVGGVFDAAFDDLKSADVGGKPTGVDRAERHKKECIHIPRRLVRAACSA